VSRRSPSLFDEPITRSTVRVEIGARSCWLYGTGLTRRLIELDIPRMRDWHPDRKGVLMCPVDRVGDLLALLEYRDRVVELSAVDR
jgi:hypothetical protein